MPQPQRPFMTWLRDAWMTLVLAAIVAVSLGVLAAATGWRETLQSLGALSAAQVALLLFLSCWNYLLRSARWFLFCRVLAIPVSARAALRHYLGGFAMTVTPGRVGELVRLRWIMQETGVAFDRIAPVMLVDRAADLAAMALLIVVTVVFGAVGGVAAMTVAALSLLAALAVTRQSLAHLLVTRAWQALGRWPRLFARARRMARALGPFSRAGVMVPALVLGAIGWFAEGLAFHLLLVWMGADIGLLTAIGIFMVAMIGGGLTGAPGGLGGAEAAMVALLSLQGVGLEVSIPATAIIRLTTLWFAIAIGLAVFPFATRAASRGHHARQA